VEPLSLWALFILRKFFGKVKEKTSVQGTIWDTIYQIVFYSPVLIIIFSLLFGFVGWIISGIAKAVQPRRNSNPHGYSQAQSSPLGEKMEAIERIERGFGESFRLAQECCGIAIVLVRTRSDLILAGIEKESMADVRTWKDTRKRVINGLGNVQTECQRYFTRIEPLARIVQIERYLRLASLGCQRCKGPGGDIRCVALEVLSDLEMLRSQRDW
jgi:hypothetical protein